VNYSFVKVAVAGTTYSFYVTAVNQQTGAESAPSNTVTVTFPGSKAVAPILNDPPFVSQNSISLQWRPADNTPVTSYRLYQVAPSSQVLSSTVERSYNYANVAAGTTYSFYVTSINLNGVESPHSNVVTVTFQQAKPTVPFLNNPLFSGTNVTLTWGAGDTSPVTQYVLYESSPQNIEISRTPNTYTSFVGVPGTTYTFYVRAINAAGVLSDPSNSVQFTLQNSAIKPAPPYFNPLTAVGPRSSQQIGLSWRPGDSTPVSQYIMYTSSPQSAEVTRTTLTTGQVGALLGVNYTFYLRAMSSAGVLSDPSNLVSITL